MKGGNYNRGYGGPGMFKISPEFVADCVSYELLVEKTSFPLRHYIIDIVYCAEDNTFAVIFASPDFPTIPSDEAIPEIIPKVTKIDGCPKWEWELRP